jgi:hypothetical protein
MRVVPRRAWPHQLGDRDQVDPSADQLSAEGVRSICGPKEPAHGPTRRCMVSHREGVRERIRQYVVEAKQQAGGGGWVRTTDNTIMSRVLYR